MAAGIFNFSTQEGPGVPHLARESSAYLQLHLLLTGLGAVPRIRWLCVVWGVRVSSYLVIINITAAPPVRRHPPSVDFNSIIPHCDPPPWSTSRVLLSRGLKWRAFLIKPHNICLIWNIMLTALAHFSIINWSSKFTAQRLDQRFIIKWWMKS